MSMLAALESMKVKLEGEVAEGEDGEISEVMMAVMESEQEVADETEEVMEMDDVVEETEDAVERLEGIRDAIKAYGISKSMMYAADPKGELCAAGIVASYEELEDAPVKDENADAAVEGITDTIKKYWKKLMDFFKMLWNKLKSWFDTVMRGFKSYETALAVMIKKVKATRIDDKKFAEAKVSTLNKKDFGRLAAVAKGLVAGPHYSNMYKEIDFLEKATDDSKVTLEDINHAIDSGIADITTAITKEATELTGLTVDGSSIVRKKAKIERKKDTTKAHGWSAGDVVGALSTALGLMNSATSAQKNMDRLTSNLSSMSKTLETQIRHIDDLEDKEVKRRQAAINGRKKLIGVVRQLIQTGLVDANNVAKMALSLGSVALSSKQSN